MNRNVSYEMRLRQLLDEAESDGELPQMVAEMAIVLQTQFQHHRRRHLFQNGGAYDMIMRAVSVALRDGDGAASRRYILEHLKLGRDGLKAQWGVTE